MQAGVAGLTFRALPRAGAYYSDFTSATDVELITFGPDDMRRVFEMTVDPSGSQATYVVASGDFPVPGSYLTQVRVVYSSGAVITSDIVAIDVGANL